MAEGYMKVTHPEIEGLEAVPKPSSWNQRLVTLILEVAVSALFENNVDGNEKFKYHQPQPRPQLDRHR